jgi:sortase A
MNKTVKTLITVGLLSMVLLPIFFFIIYPNYNNLIGPIKRLNLQRLSEEVTFQFLTEIAPTKENALGVTDTVSTNLSIEESLGEILNLEKKYLEEVNTTVIVNSIEVEGKIFEGLNSRTMDNGFWHFPTSQLPGTKGNFVVIGHRYAKLPPSKDTFFNLDKVKVGDRVEVKQSNDEYTYIVTSTKEVDKNDISVIKDYSDYRLTLITCSPLWSSDKRLVITAKLDKLYKNT